MFMIRLSQADFINRVDDPLVTRARRTFALMRDEWPSTNYAFLRADVLPDMEDLGKKKPKGKAKAQRLR